MGTAQDKVETGTQAAKRGTERAGEKTEDLISKAATPSRNSHS
jgi:hypothetical protein